MSQVTSGVTETQDARQLRRRLRLGEVLVSEGLTSEAEIHAVSYTHLTLPTNREV